MWPLLGNGSVSRLPLQRIDAELTRVAMKVLDSYTPIQYEARFRDNWQATDTLQGVAQR
jgi:hypothetical protein